MYESKPIAMNGIESIKKCGHGSAL
ncbi:MAG: DUF1508 domain-containing protein [Methylophilaceae bacterium]|nr:DUF1508 domain-containing protein [Methylophilaceae bacterium]